MGITNIYNNEIDTDELTNYIDSLINKVFALLPMFEESSLSDDNKTYFLSNQDSVITLINGNFALFNNYDSYVSLDIISRLESLKQIEEHSTYKKYIFKICHLLSHLKEEMRDKNV